MRIGKQDAPYSAICTSDAESITVRGRDLVGEIIGKMDFTSYFWLLVTGEEPNEDQAFFANAILCALAEHGLVPSVVAARMTLAAAPEAMQGAVAAGLLGCGSVVLGSAEVAGRFYAECVADKHARGVSADQAARDGIARLRAEKKAIPGFGHPQHSEGDPRANLLLELAGSPATPRPAGQRQRPDSRNPARSRLAARRAQGHRPAVPHRRPGRALHRGSRAADRVHPVGRGRGGD